MIIIQLLIAKHVYLSVNLVKWIEKLVLLVLVILDLKHSLNVYVTQVTMILELKIVKSVIINVKLVMLVPIIV